MTVVSRTTEIWPFEFRQILILEEGEKENQPLVNFSATETEHAILIVLSFIKVLQFHIYSAI